MVEHDGFPAIIKTRLINPSKTHIGKVAKSILDRVNADIRSKSDLVQWKNTQEVLDWFTGITDKSKKCFIKFDIVDFYPSITSESISHALKFARVYSKIPKKQERIIRHACKTLLFHNNETWVKKGSKHFFDVPMGSFHGAELCELVGLHILHEIKSIFTAGYYGLYRDDGLAVVKAEARCNLKKIEQQVRDKMKSLGFDITIESGFDNVDFLDVNLNLKLDIFNPYKKPDSKLMYVNRLSNHPPSVTKSIPNMVIQRICRLSKNEEIFNSHSREYIDELKSCGYNIENLSYEAPSGRKRKRRRNVFYFHPPFCKSVKTKFGRIFRDLVNKHFTPNHVLHKIFNKNTLKISYSCMPNMKAILETHNRKIAGKYKTSEDAGCNCRRKDQCPLNGKCLTKNVIYKATVSTPPDAQSNMVYFGSTKRKFKSRYTEHKSSFTSKEESTSKLSRHVRKIIKSRQDYKIDWEIVKRSNQPAPTVKFCTLCNLERREIAQANKANLLNSRNELITTCVHGRNLFFAPLKQSPAARAVAANSTAVT